MIKFNFDINKIIQIVNFLLKRNNGKLNYTKLIKLLYIADKECLKRWNFTITGDEYYSLPAGPILTETLDLIKLNNSDKIKQLFWNNNFIKDGWNLILKNKKNQNNIDLLCDAEEEILIEIDNKYKKYSFKDMIEVTHGKNGDNFSEVEWQKAEKENTSIPIDIENIFFTIGRKPEEIEIIKNEINSQLNDAKILSECCE